MNEHFLDAIAETSVTTNYTGELFILAGIGLTAILGWIGGAIVKKLREPTRIETLWNRLDTQDGKINALETRVNTAERVAGASGRVIRDLARQWPADHVPRLNPSDLDILDEDTIPSDHPWRMKP